MESTQPSTTAPVAAAPSGEQASATAAPDATAAPVVDALVASQQRDPLGRFASNGQDVAAPTEAAVNPTEAAPALAPTPAAEPNAVVDAPPALPSDVEIQQQVQDALREAQNAITSRDERLKTLEDDLAKREQAAKEKAENEEKERLELQGKLAAAEKANQEKQEQLEASQKRQLAAAQKSSVDMLAQLHATLRQVRGSKDGTVVQPPANNDPAAVAEFGKHVAQEAINSMKELAASKDQTEMQCHQQKRTHEQAMGALVNFGGTPPVANQMGTVNASAQGYTPQTDDAHSRQIRRKVDTPLEREASRAMNLRAYYEANQGACYGELNNQLMAAGSARCGVVNASRHMWQKQDLEEEEPAPRLNAMHLHPELFGEMCRLNTGRMPSGSDVMQLYGNMNTTPTRVGPGR